ncbi:LuxR C-terminal-related transcriptional regulator [Kitasatospora sp. NPDC059648]|uniref:helix-turn-helix transcriptional regulator n=1 Tax=Kitasatospora sp. NPDC059648 TaxID=3346894 RepID=UPI0036961443
MPTGAADPLVGITEKRADSTLLSSARLLASQGSADQVAALLRALVTDPLGLLRALASVGSVDRAVELLGTALTLGLPAELNARLRCLLVELRLAGGEVRLALATAEEILGRGARGTPELPPTVRSAVLAGRAFGRHFQDPDRGRRHAESVLRGYDDRIAPDAEVLAAMAVLSGLVLSDGRLTEGLRLARAAVDGAQAMPSPVWRAYLHLVLADRLLDAGAYGDAESTVRAAVADLIGLGGGGMDSVVALHRARLLGHRGRLAEARDEAQQALAAAMCRGTLLYVPPLLATLGQLALRFGDHDGAEAFVRRYRRTLADGVGRMPSPVYDWVELQVTAARHGAHAALTQMDQQYSHPAPRAALFTRQPGAAAWFVRTALEAGDPHWAAVAAREAERLAEDNPGVPTLAASAVHAVSLLHGDPDGLVRAATEHGHHWARTAAAEDLAALLDTRSRLRTAGAGADADAMAGTPARPRLPAPPATPALTPAPVPPDTPVTPASDPAARAAEENADALSDVERTVAHLVSQGLTNQQVASRIHRSPHTVNYHLRNIFRKVGLSSRVELARHAHLWTTDRPGIDDLGIF